MTPDLPSRSAATAVRRHFAPVVWASSAIGAAVIVLGVTGTLSSWTEAVIGNNTNTVASTKAVSLSESTLGSATPCVDTASTIDNTATCTTINKYGGTDLPLDPDGRNVQRVTVTMKNTGTETGRLALRAAGCLSSAVPDSAGKPTTYPLCNVVTVSVACTGGAVYTSPAPVTLTDFAAELDPRAIGGLTASAATDCTFTLTLPSTTPAGYASQIASQVLTWTLSA